MLILVVDDEDYRHGLFHAKILGHDLWHAFDISRAKYLLGKMNFDVVYLDFDLGPKEKATDIIEFIDKMLVRPRAVVVHSFNEPAAQKMMEMMKDWNSTKSIRSVFGPNMVLPDQISF